MPESLPKTLIFLHIPKAGGSTLRKLLHRQVPDEATYKIESDISGDILRLGTLDETRRDQIRLVTGHMSFGLHEHFEDARYITLLREPIKRVISEYRFIVSNRYHVLHPSVSKMSLLEYLDSGLSGQTHNGQTRLIAGIWKDGQCGVAGNRAVTELDFHQAIHNLNHYFILPGTLDHYDETLIAWQQAFGWPWPLYQRANVTPSRFSSPGDQEIAAIVKRNQWDLKLYQYVTQLEAERLSAHPYLHHWRMRAFRSANWVYSKSLSARRRWRAMRS